MYKLPENFAINVFSDKVMQQRLPKNIYSALKNTMVNGEHLQLDVANTVATAMKEWAVERGVTHFTHWFQPNTGFTAEKHDSFLTPCEDGTIIMEFSGKELVKGEPDASSFPNGGLRATNEARGYTAWDPTSYAFIKGTTLYIPTAFCSYSGEALDKKTPLLRSMQALDKAAVKVLRLLGNDTVKHVRSNVGAEQEYFLIDKELYKQRLDLVNTGRTLFGASPAKTQELDDHYFGAIKPRVAAYMIDLDEELWKLGVTSKTKHNEVAPCQHELAPIYTTTNVATDHNQIVMDVMQSVADKHGFACLLHEKPFAGINGSGKHNNWSIITDEGENLLKPVTAHKKNLQFMLFLSAVIKSVNDYQDLLRLTTASASNDHRLGANEAPPAIISMFLGDELMNFIEAIKSKNEVVITKQDFELGADVLPHFAKDTTDRNRTSPFAFTGNKFEFRMLGSRSSIADVNTVLNTIVADSLNYVYDRLVDKCGDDCDFDTEIAKRIVHILKYNDRVIFNGDGYSDAWVEESAKRGLLNLKDTPAAISHMLDEKNLAMFEKFGVFTRSEYHSRYEIKAENYAKVVRIEAKTLLEMIAKNILPSAFAYQKQLLDVCTMKSKLSLESEVEKSLVRKITALTSVITEKASKIENNLKIDSFASEYDRAVFTRDEINEVLDSIRVEIDELEATVSSECWTLPTYSDLLNSLI